MSQPDQQQSPQEQDEFDLDQETVQDLEVDEQDADAVRGGPGTSGNAQCARG